MRFSNAGGPRKATSLAWRMKLPVARSKNLFAMDGRIEAPVEVFQRFEAAEISGLGAAFHEPLLAHIDFVLADQF
jgi:hypothetical protein